jgi:hypothetical protein
MKNKNNTNLEKNNEIMDTINPDNLNTISIHSKILQTSDNIFITFKKTKIRIKLLNFKSLQKISSLLNNIPLEKNIKFKSGFELTDTESDSDPDSKNGLKGIAKLKERLHKSDNNNNFENIRNRYRRNKKYPIYAINKNQYIIKKRNKNSVILLDEVKSSVNSILNKEGNSIGTNYELYKMTWKNLYRWLLIFPLIILGGLFFFIYKDNYGFTFAEIVCYFIVFLVCLVSMNGNEKMLAKKKVNFKTENLLLNLISFFSFYILICTHTDIIENTAYCFLNEYYIIVCAIFFTLIVFCFVIIYLNKKMVNFYHKYSQIVESGVLFTDRS